jgi:hypothetical protein
MSESTWRKFYRYTEFVAMGGVHAEPEQFETHLASLDVLDPHVFEFADGLGVEWPTADPPLAALVATVTAAVAAFNQPAPSSAPIELNSFGATSVPNATVVPKITHTTPPLAAGTYQVCWASQLKMAAVIANTGIEGKLRVDRSDGAFVEQVDSWDLTAKHAFNGAVTFVVSAGQTLTVALSATRIGASGTGEISGARVTIDRL